MRSRPKPKRAAVIATLLLASLAIFNCTGETDLAEDVCGSLEQCAQYIKEETCTSALNDAVDDGRITPAELTRCSRCLVNNNDTDADDRSDDAKGSCETLLNDRDCDRACENVGLVLGARTSRNDRDTACKNVADACHVAGCPDGIGVPGETIAQMEANDAVVEACIRCIALVPVPVAEADGGAGGAAAGGAAARGSRNAGGTQNSSLDQSRCDQMIEKCASPCLGVTAIDTRLTLAQTARVYCSNPRSCDGTGSGGDANKPSGAGGEGGASECLPQPLEDGCVQGFLCKERTSAKTLEHSNPRLCLTCLQASACSEMCDQCDVKAGQ